MTVIYRISTDVLLWIYWTAIAAVLVCAVPVIVYYALLMDED